MALSSLRKSALSKPQKLFSLLLHSQNLFVLRISMFPETQKSDFYKKYCIYDKFCRKFPYPQKISTINVTTRGGVVSMLTKVIQSFIYHSNVSLFCYFIQNNLSPAPLYFAYSLSMFKAASFRNTAELAFVTPFPKSINHSIKHFVS